MNEHEFLNKVLLGHAPAVDYCIVLGSISQAWDDIIDGDKEITANAVNRAFFDALVTLPANPFFIQYRSLLLPVQQAIIFDWFDANQLESGDSHDKSIAFILRNSLVTIVVQCAYLVGGYEHAKEVGPEIRRYFFDETLEEYMTCV